MQGLDSKFVHSVLEFAITSSSRSPVDFVPHQQIIWILEALDTKSTGSSTIAPWIRLLFCFLWPYKTSSVCLVLELSIP